MFTLAFFGSMGPMEVVVLLVLGLLIFGKRLPDIGRNVGKSIVEFKKGLAGVDDDVNAAANAPRGGNMAPPPQQYQQPPAQQYQQYQQPQQYAQPQAQQYQQPQQQIPAQPQQQAEARPANQPDQVNRQA